MASPGKEELEYESDPEEVKRSLAMRRKEASDDEDGGRDGENDDKPGLNRRADMHSDESDGQGGAEEYDDDEDEEELDLEDEEDEVYDYEEEGDEFVEGRDDADGDERRIDAEGSVMKDSKEPSANHSEEEKKENEPFAVPTAGAFYMHDDRFSDNVGGRHRRMRGGRRLWESKDDRKWGHDKFEEMNMQERHYQERRASRGRFRGRGRNRGPDRRFAGGSRSKTYNSSNNGNQRQAPKSVRGRGPRKYEHILKNSSQAALMQAKNSGNSLEGNSRVDSGGATVSTAHAESSMVATKKNSFASSLNSASPPFYPSGSSNNVRQKRDIHAGSMSRNPNASAVDENFSASQPKASLRGKNIVDSIGMDKLHINDSTGKTLGNTHMPSSGSSRVSTGQPRAQGRGTPSLGQVTYQPVPSHSQGNSGSQPKQLRAGQKSPASGLQAMSPPKTASSINSNDGKGEAASEIDKQKGTFVGKGKGNLQGTGRGSFLYGGTQVMGAAGNLAASHGDPNFPAFFPVMQFGGQHPGGMGVPAVGMAFPGYVAHSQLGLGNSEMTWLPVLAGTGAMGATYPYIAVDGSYHARSPGQSLTAGSSSKENSANKPSNSQRPDSTADELLQRQSNPNKQPRRYSEMNFSK